MVRKPDDFDAYWNEALRLVDAYEPEVSISRWELEDPAFEGEYVVDGGLSEPATTVNPDVNPFDFRWNTHAILTGLAIRKVAFRSFDGQEVGGLLQYPKTGGTARRYPGIVHFTGYGGELMVDQDFVSAGYAVFQFSHRGMMWGSRGFDRYRPVPLLVRGIEDRERYVYRSIVIDCLLAVKAMRTLEMVEEGRIAVMGTSQGAALSVMTGALDPRVGAVSCDLPWLTDFEWQLSHEVEGPYNELKEWLARHPEGREAALGTLGYFDTLSFADSLEAPAVVSLGLADGVCAPESVRNLFGRLRTVKMLLELPGIGHERGTLWRAVTRGWFDFHL